MRSRAITLILLVGLTVSLGTLIPKLMAYRLPGNQQGYEPVQPIAYSHRLHAGELQIDCQYCHFGADRSRHAGIPPARVCMNCHRFVTAPWGAVRAEADLAQKEGRAARRLVSPELQKLYNALGLDEKLHPDPGKTPAPIAWIKVYNLPDFVYFDHRAHVHAGVVCQTCHGPVETMERVWQVPDLSMGWCLGCHREPARFVAGNGMAGPSADCSTCHY